jgi:hypothetical protein
LEQPCRQHRQYLLSNNSQLTESEIFQLQDEQFATWFRTHVSTTTNSLSLARLLLVYKWLQSLRFPDGHALNISRLVNMEEYIILIYWLLLYLIYKVYQMEESVTISLSLLSLGLERKFKCYNVYFVNGYVFQTEEYKYGKKNIQQRCLC